MADDLIGYYRSLLENRWAIREAVCLTYVRGIDEDSMIRAFGGDPTNTAPRSIDELDDGSGGYGGDDMATLLVAAVGDWLVGVEPNGFQGSRPEVLRGASAGGSAVSVYWNINASNRFQVATRGAITVAFDMLRPEDRWGREPDAISGYLDGLPFGHHGHTWEAGLALAERITGVRLTTELLDGHFRRAVLHELPEDLVPESLLGDPALDHPFIREVLAEPTPDKLPRIARYLAEVVARDAGIEDDADVRAALAALAAGTPAPGRLRQRLLDRAKEESSTTPRDEHLLRRTHALRGIGAALHPDPVQASSMVHFSAGYSLRNPVFRIHNAVLGRCWSRAVSQVRGRS